MTHETLSTPFINKDRPNLSQENQIILHRNEVSGFGLIPSVTVAGAVPITSPDIVRSVKERILICINLVWMCGAES